MMDHLLVPLYLLAMLAPGGYALCNSDTPLPLRYSGQVLSTGGACSATQQQTAAIEEDIDHLIDSLLPQLQSSLSPSPCAGLGWTKVAHLDMTNSSHACPQGWSSDDENGRLCKRSSAGCSKALFPTNGVEYSEVCGRVKAYQRGSTEAFEEYTVDRSLGLSDHYVDGVVVTHGSPMKHVWTLAAGVDETKQDNTVCPCVTGSTGAVPAFVGQNYFCDTGIDLIDPNRRLLYLDDPLWDGQGCGPNSDCCTFNNPPYFSASLPLSTCDDLEVRICTDDANEDVLVELVELYVK